MMLQKHIIRIFCKPPASMKGDYRYTERKYLNILFLCQMCLSFAPGIISLFIDINYNPKRMLVVAPMYLVMLFFMWLRSYKLFTGSMIISTLLVKYNYWTSVDRGIVLASPFFSLIFAATLIPSKKFLTFIYILTFAVSYFFVEDRFCEFLRTAPRDELVSVFKKSFTSMLQIFSISFCHLLIGRYIHEKICEKQLAMKTTIALQNEELQKMNQNLTKALESRESFILSFSHETRNPLNGIIGNLHLLSEVKVCSKGKVYLQRANICAKILNNILLTILDSRRTGQSAVDITLRPQLLDMSIYIQEIWTLCREIIRMKNITPLLEIGQRFPRWLAFDPERITQVAMNLVNNAMKFTQKGYIRLKFDWMPQNKVPLDESNEPVFFTSSDAEYREDRGKNGNSYKPEWYYQPKVEEKGLLLISVEDTGCGIKEEYQKVIFDKFSQVTASAELKSLGLGLGLWIAKTIINLHGGNILLESKEGFGSCFTGTVSSVAKPPENKRSCILELENALEKRKSEPKSSQLRALVVEDFPINQNINSEMLKKYGFTHIEIAADGQKGLDLFKKRGKNFFDLVTMDLEMPVMKGKESIALMRKWETENNLPPTKIIVISGNAIDKEVNECLDVRGNIRADVFLFKPCSYKSLTDTLARLEVGMKVNIGTQVETQAPRTQIILMEKRPKILFADDDVYNIDILVAYAKKMQLEHLVAKDGAEACRIFEAQGESIDMILLDYKMPHMNGPEASENIRKKMSAGKRCLIYLLSGMEKVTGEAAKKFDGIIQKPLTFEKFEEVISGVLSKK